MLFVHDSQVLPIEAHYLTDGGGLLLGQGHRTGVQQNVRHEAQVSVMGTGSKVVGEPERGLSELRHDLLFSERRPLVLW